MKHRMKIHITRRNPEDAILEYATRRLAPSLWNLLFGRRRKVVILIPGDSVDAVDIVEQLRQYTA